MEETKKRIDITPRLVMGLTVLGVGLLFTLDALDLFEVGAIINFWPLLLGFVGLSKLQRARRKDGSYNTSTLVVGGLWIFAGVWWTLDNLRIVDVHVWELWPILLIVAGVHLVRRALASKTTNPAVFVKVIGAGEGSAYAVCSAVRRSINDKNFKQGDYTAFMGGCEIDLSQATMAAEGAVIDVFAFWGGIDLKVPKTVTIESQVTAVLGAFEDKTDRSQADPQQKLLIRGMAMMGGVDVKN